MLMLGLLIIFILVVCFLFVLFCTLIQSLIAGAVLYGLMLLLHMAFGTVMISFIHACVIGLFILVIISLLRKIFKSNEK